MNWLNSLLSEGGATVEAIATAEVGAYNIAGVGIGMPLPSVRAAPAS